MAGTSGSKEIATVSKWDGLLSQIEGAMESGCFDLNDTGDAWQAETLLGAREAILRVVQLEAEQDWQPIETAKQDMNGEPILVTWTKGKWLKGHMRTVRWAYDNDTRKADWAEAMGNETGCQFSEPPTHWRPLPPGPTERSDEH